MDARLTIFGYPSQTDAISDVFTVCRRKESVSYTHHLKLKPGTNVAFANGIMNVIISEGLQDEKFIAERTEGYEKIKEIVKDYTPERVAEICHICLLYTSRCV